MKGFRKTPIPCIPSPPGECLTEFLEELKLQIKQRKRKVLPRCLFTQDLEDFWMFASRSMAFEHMICRRNSVKFKQGSSQPNRGCPWEKSVRKGESAFSQLSAIHMLEVWEHPLIRGILARMRISQMAVPLFYLHGDSLFCSFPFSTGLSCIENFCP